MQLPINDSHSCKKLAFRLEQSARDYSAQDTLQTVTITNNQEAAN
jgi:hypothetical protein